LVEVFEWSSALDAVQLV
jgi:hypothetical protein